MLQGELDSKQKQAANVADPYFNAHLTTFHVEIWPKATSSFSKRGSNSQQTMNKTNSSYLNSNQMRNNRDKTSFLPNQSLSRATDYYSKRVYPHVS